MKLHETLREQRRGVENREECTKDHLAHEKRKGVLVGVTLGKTGLGKSRGENSENKFCLKKTKFFLEQYRCKIK